jgi:hypothetical protein
MKPPTGKLMATALRRCRDAEIAWEQRSEIDLADPRNRREFRGWGIRVNYEGRLGWAWGEPSELPEMLLDRSLQAARSSPLEGILFAHGLPIGGASTTTEPLALDGHLDKLHRYVSKLQFLLPSLLKDHPTRIRASLRWAWARRLASCSTGATTATSVRWRCARRRRRRCPRWSRRGCG